MFFVQFLKSKAQEGEVVHMWRPLPFSLLLGATAEVKSLGLDYFLYFYMVSEGKAYSLH